MWRRMLAALQSLMQGTEEQAPEVFSGVAMPQQSEPGYVDYGEDDILIGPYGDPLVIQTLLEYLGDALQTQEERDLMARIYRLFAYEAERAKNERHLHDRYMRGLCHLEDWPSLKYDQACTQDIFPRIRYADLAPYDKDRHCMQAAMVSDVLLVSRRLDYVYSCVLEHGMLDAWRRDERYNLDAVDQGEIYYEVDQPEGEEQRGVIRD